MKNYILSVEDIYKIIDETKINGVYNTCLKYGICLTNFHNWVQKIKNGEDLALSHEENIKLKKPIEGLSQAFQ